MSGMGLLLVVGVLTVVGGLAAVVVMTLRNGRPSSSIAQVLYDTENPSREGTRPGQGSGR